MSGMSRAGREGGRLNPLTPPEFEGIPISRGTEGGRGRLLGQKLDSRTHGMLSKSEACSRRNMGLLAWILAPVAPGRPCWRPVGVLLASCWRSARACPAWTCLDMSGPVRTRLDQSGPAWTCLDHPQYSSPPWF